MMNHPIALRSLTIAALALGALVAGCGGSDEGGRAPGSGGSPSGRPTTVTITDFRFRPPEVAVEAGTKITFDNRDTAAHTASAGDQSFDTGGIQKGQSKAVTVDKPGRINYVCEFHPFMKAVVVVK